jgi:two-component system response regulator AtoC
MLAMVYGTEENPTHASVGAVSAVAGNGFVGVMSPSMQALESVIAEIAPTNIPVLLVGESGTGKQMFAHRIHILSPRREEAFVKFSCSSMTPHEFSAELGHPGNGDAGAKKCAPGTMVFDEISELDAVCQRTLLHALPDDETGAPTGAFTARVISTTSRNLDDEVRAGRFRSGLFYRINGVCLCLPPLRECKEDIPLLTEFFLTKHAAQLGRTRPSLSPRALAIFLEHTWPGNVRELENVVKGIVALGDEELAVSQLTAMRSEKRPAATNMRSDSLKVAAKAASREAERELILKALARTRWNRKRAAQELQVSYKSLLYKLKQIGAEEPEVRTV